MVSADDNDQKDRSLLVDVVQELISGAGLGSATAFVELQAGHASTVWQVTVDGPRPAAVVKVYRQEFSWKQSKEIYVYGLLQDVAVPAPAVLAFGGQGSGADPAFVILEWLPGVSPRQLPDVTVDERRSMCRGLGALMRQVHTVRLDGFGYVIDQVINPKPTNSQFMQLVFDRVLSGEVEIGGDPAIGAGTRRLLQQTGPALDECDAPVLCHDDIHLGNVLVDPAEPARIVGLIDVENTFAADPLFDVAKALLNLAVDTTDCSRCLLEGYGDLGRRSEERLRLYQIYHLLEFWNWATATDQPWPLEPIEEQLRTLLRP